MLIVGASYTNPVIDYNTPDPGVLALPDGSGYVLVSTSNYAERGIGETYAFVIVSSFILCMYNNFYVIDNNTSHF